MSGSILEDGGAISDDAMKKENLKQGILENYFKCRVGLLLFLQVGQFEFIFCTYWHILKKTKSSQ